MSFEDDMRGKIIDDEIADRNATITEEDVDIEFSNLIGQLDNNQFWAYIRSWKDEQDLMETMNNWDMETKQEAIKEIKEKFLK